MTLRFSFWYYLGSFICLGSIITEYFICSLKKTNFIIPYRKSVINRCLLYRKKSNQSPQAITITVTDTRRHGEAL